MMISAHAVCAFVTLLHGQSVVFFRHLPMPGGLFTYATQTTGDLQSFDVTVYGLFSAVEYNSQSLVCFGWIIS
jgi:hypothetical protein